MNNTVLFGTIFAAILVGRLKSSRRNMDAISGTNPEGRTPTRYEVVRKYHNHVTHSFICENGNEATAVRDRLVSEAELREYKLIDSKSPYKRVLQDRYGDTVIIEAIIIKK